MDYDAVLAQVLALLQQEQRVAYRILKRRFALDDHDLEDLKDDLIYAKKLAVDEAGRVLVWTGGTSSALASLSPVPPPAMLDVSPTQSEATPIVPPPPDAERRQLTVMFCDLVDSTKLSSQLDPEEYRDVVRAYQRVCTEVIQRYDGHIAQLLGDGLLVYFGYPQAHEDDPHRAVRTGLGILAAMGNLNTRLHQAKGIQLAIRLGIHTGLVVVGAMGGAGRQEQLHWGKRPTLPPGYKDWRRPIPLPLVTRHIAWCKGIFSAMTWEHKICVASPSPYTYTTCSARVVPPVALILLSPEDSRRWWVESRKSRCSWNGGSKRRQDMGR
jgi:class 3 adenylate cyclase